MFEKLSPNAKKYLVDLIESDMVNGNGFGCKEIARLTMLQEYDRRQWTIRARYELQEFKDELKRGLSE